MVIKAQQVYCLSCGQGNNPGLKSDIKKKYSSPYKLGTSFKNQSQASGNFAHSQSTVSIEIGRGMESRSSLEFRNAELNDRDKTESRLDSRSHAEDVENSFRNFKSSFHTVVPKKPESSKESKNLDKNVKLESRDSSLEHTEYLENRETGIKTVNLSGAIGNQSSIINADVKLTNRRPMSARNTVYRSGKILENVAREMDTNNKEVMLNTLRQSNSKVLKFYNDGQKRKGNIDVESKLNQNKIKSNKK
mmetsp:Transcript_99129/g.213940  ORF Transcript_99129/g.213940 Transcript_99129/m.213940 type:complete len:248 (-) Transcript_99129:76-819(-)